MDKRDIESIYPLNSVQQALLFHCLGPRESDPGFLHVRFTLRGTLHADELEDAWSTVLASHESTRMSLQTPTRQQPMLVVSKECATDWCWEDLRDLPEPGQRGRIEEYCREDRRRGLDLKRPPVLRFAGFRTADDQHEFVWTCHHLLLDGWSATVILRELFQCYGGRRSGRHVELPSRRSHRDFLAWRRRQSTEAAEAFWRDYWRGLTEPTTLSRFRGGGPSQSGSGPSATHLSESVLFPDGLGRDIQDAASNMGVTAAAIVHAAWALFVAAATDSRDVAFGATTSGRSYQWPNHESMTGCFAGTLPRRCVLDPDKPLADWLQAIHRDHFQTQLHEHLSLADIIRCSEIPGHQSLLDSLLVFENLPWRDVRLDVDGGITLCNYAAGVTTTYPLTVVVTPADPWSLHYIYDDARLPAKELHVAMRLLPLVLRRIASDPARPLKSLVEWLEVELANYTDAETERHLIATSRNSRAVRTDASKNDASADQVAAQLARDPTELEIAKIWEGLLGISGVDIHADFLSLGGRSLLAVRMLAMIEDRLGVRVSLADLVAGPTIAQLAATIQQSQGAAKWRSLVPIQPQGSRPPLICVHAEGGHVLFLRGLARRMGVDQPMFGLQPVGLDGECPPMTTFERIATHYIDELRTVQPAGPYYLMGHCHGAQVAFEMASQLKAAGEEIALLAVLDSIPPKLGPKKTPKSRSQSTRNNWRRIVTGRWWELFRVVRTFVKDHWGPFRDRWSHAGKRRWVLLFGTSYARKQLHLKTVRRACDHAYAIYRGRPLDVKVTLVRTSEARDTHLAWREAAADFESVTVSIGHRTMFVEPDVQRLARTLETLIEQARQANRANSRNNLLDVSSSS